MDELLPALRHVNPKLPEAAITEAVYKLRYFEGGSVLQKNVRFMDYLQNGVSVNYFDKGEQRAALVRLVDFENTEHNSFTAVNQWTISENSDKRPDVIVFLNGLPVVVFELKSPSREETDASEAYRQLRNYMKEIPSLFIYNAFCVMSDLAISKAGTITADEDRFTEWKTKDGSYENTQYAQFDTFIEGIFDKARLLDIIKNFICSPATRPRRVPPVFRGTEGLGIHRQGDRDRRARRRVLAYPRQRQILVDGFLRAPVTGSAELADYRRADRPKRP